jgi:tetratricopeptide (TPR) repeat protein
VRRGFLITVAVIVVVAAVVFMWWLPAYRESELQKQVEAIEMMEDLTAKKEAALIFLVNNQMADRELLLRALDAAASEFRGADDTESVIELYEALYTEDLTAWLRYRIIARLDRALIATEDPARAQRAEDLARAMIEVNDAPMEPYHWMVYFHQRSEHTDPELTLRVALAAERATDRDEYGMWGSMLDMAYRRLLTSVVEEQGLEAALSRSQQLAEQTELPMAIAALNAAVYDIAISENEGRALEAAVAMAELEGLTDSEPMKRIAYDMAERGLAPDVAVTLSKKALELASSRYDSTMVLDTVGWAHYAAGEYAEAAGYLKTAVTLMDETLTSDNETVQHLLTAYDSAGMTDEQIELLAMVAARSVDADDPARRNLAELLVQRDGDTAAMEELVLALRYEGVKVAPAFRLRSADGEIVSLDSFRGDVLVLNFWSYG